jgi:hypothetical protein
MDRYVLTRMVQMNGKCNPSAPKFSESHWLRLDAHGTFAVSSFKAISMDKLSYLAELVSAHKPAIKLESDSRKPDQACVEHVVIAFSSCAFHP